MTPRLRLFTIIVLMGVLAIPVGIANAERHRDTEVAMAGIPAEATTTSAAPTTDAPAPTTAAPTTEAPTTTAAPAITAPAPTTTAAPVRTTVAPTTAAPTTTAAPAPATEATPPPTATAPTDIMLSAFDGAAAEPVSATASPSDEAAVARKSRAARLATVPPPPPPSPLSQLSYADQQFLACVRWRESRNDYTVVNSSSGAGGAYQFLQSTWNNTAAHMGRYDLVGVRPNWAAPIDQDAIAVHLLQWYGRSPWAGPGC